MNAYSSDNDNDDDNPRRVASIHAKALSCICQSRYNRRNCGMLFIIIVVVSSIRWNPFVWAWFARIGAILGTFVSRYTRNQRLFLCCFRIFILHPTKIKICHFRIIVLTRNWRFVSVRGKAKFTWKSTGKIWNEVFIYRIQLDEEGKILIYEVWADSGAAYLASTINKEKLWRKWFAGDHVITSVTGIIQENAVGMQRHANRKSINSSLWYSIATAWFIHFENCFPLSKPNLH